MFSNRNIREYYYFYLADVTAPGRFLLKRGCHHGNRSGRTALRVDNQTEIQPVISDPASILTRGGRQKVGGAATTGRGLCIHGRR